MGVSSPGEIPGTFPWQLPWFLSLVRLLESKEGCDSRVTACFCLIATFLLPSLTEPKNYFPKHNRVFQSCLPSAKHQQPLHSCYVSQAPLQAFLACWKHMPLEAVGWSLDAQPSDLTCLGACSLCLRLFFITFITLQLFRSTLASRCSLREYA